MFFILRSAFWLTIAFVLIAPRGQSAGDLPARALDAGRDFVVGQTLGVSCDSLECSAGKAALKVLAGPSSPSAVAPMQVNGSPVPLPRPRPDRMG